MNATTQRDIAIQLITNDLINCKLIYGLHALHIDAGSYSLFLAASILILIGFDKAQQSSELYDVYASMSRKATEVSFDGGDHTELQALALEIYEALQSRL